MANSISTRVQNGKKVYVVSIDGGTSMTLSTADTYVDKNVIISAKSTEDATAPDLQNKTVIPTESIQDIIADFEYDGLESVRVEAIPADYIGSAVPRDTEGTPIATKGNVINHSIAITPSVENKTGYITGGVKTGSHVTVEAADLVSGSQTISTNTTTDVTNLKEVVTAVPPLIITLTATVPTSGQNTISFTGLPSMPRAWTLDCAQSTANVTWNNIYRCISARYDGTKTYTYTAYKGNQGSANPYIYMVDNGSGFTQTYNNGTLTFTTNGTGSQTYCGPFLARTYVLMAVCDNDGGTEVYRA